MGATAYFIVGNAANILIDCPAWNAENQQFLQDQGGVQRLILTHRGAISRVKEWQQAFQCEVGVQEQEAYLVPGVTLTTFQHSWDVTPDCQAIWTPGHSPGSACVYWKSQGGVLFSGRHLLPNSQGEPMPLRTSKTFHWRRQLASVERLQQAFQPETLSYLCPGANTGFLRGKGVIDQAYQRLTQIDLEALRGVPAFLSGATS